MDDTGAIHFASQKGHIEAVRTLLSSGASVKCTNRKGMTPLHFAVQGSHLQLAKYLIRKGANLSSKNKSGETPLDLIKSEEMRSLLDEFELSLKKNKDQTARTEEFPLKASDAEAHSNRDQDDADSDANDEREKRKGGGEKEDATQGILPDAKKTKVSLAHLLDEDAAEEEF